MPLRLLLALCALLSCTLSVCAQQIRSVSGYVINDRLEPMTGNAYALSPADSSIIAGGSLMNGAFELKVQQRQSLLLKLSSFEFRDTFIRVTDNDTEAIRFDTIRIRSQEQMLGEVRITGRTPLMRQTAAGNMEVNVAGTILESSSSVSEILSRTPGVSLDENGELRVTGRGQAILYLNGKRINPERMATIPVAQIIRIEVIANPSSRYDADGKAVINIVTRANDAAGWNGSLRQYGQYSAFGGPLANTFFDAGYSGRKFSLLGNYSLQTGNERELLHTTRTRPNPGDYLESDLSTDWQRRFSSYHNYGLGAQYNLNAKTNISLTYSGNSDHLGGSVNSANRLTTLAGISRYTSDNDKNELRYNHSLIFNFNKTIDSLGSAIFIGSQYAYYNATTRDQITENSRVNDTIGQRFLKSNMDHEIMISGTQADYTRVFKAGNKLEAGAKFSYAFTSSGSAFFISDHYDGDYQPDPALSSRFRYEEKITAAYLMYSTTAAKLNLQAGVRSEWTTYQLSTTAGKGQSIENSYLNWFPDIQLALSASPELKLHASYQARIIRPRYQALNPWVVYQDPFTTIEGNPNLVPEKVHNIEAGLNYRQVGLKLGYSYSIDPLTGSALRGSTPNSYVLKGINLDKGHNYYIELTGNISLSWWSSTNVLNFSYHRLTDRQYNLQVRTPRPQLYLYTSNSFTIGRWFTLQLMAWYQSPQFDGLYDANSMASVTAAIEKSVLRNALKLSFSANDLFHQFFRSGNYNVGQTDIYYHRTYSSRYFKLGVAYRFGQSKQGGYRSKATGQQEANRAN